MPQIVAVLGRGLVPAEQAVVTADDLGLTRGDGIFDATRVVTDADGVSIVENLDRHLARLTISASAVELPAPDVAAIAALADEALAAWTTPGEAVLKIVHTRGLEHGTPGATTLLTITDMTPGDRAPIAVATMSRGYASDAFADAPWLLGGAKLLSYAVHTSARREAARRGADDALFVSSDGYALEGPTSSLVWVRDGVIHTTPTGATGILASVTVDLIDEWAAAHGVRFERALTTIPELYEVTGAWLASSGRGVSPIATLDGRPLPVSAEWTGKLAAAAGF